MRDSKCCRRIVPNAVVWIVVISMAFPFMYRIECLERVVANGLIRIAFLVMVWMFVRSIDCRNTISIGVGHPI
jgi:hypothetical protein